MDELTSQHADMPDPQPMCTISVRVSADMRRAFKLACAGLGASQQEILQAFVANMIRDYRVHPEWLRQRLADAEHSAKGHV